MKSFVYFTFILFLMKCGGPTTPNVKIRTGLKGNQATWGDTLDLKLNKTLEGTTVAYFLNDQPIATDHSFSDEPLGIHILKALISQGDDSFETTASLTLLAPNPPVLYTY